VDDMKLLSVRRPDVLIIALPLSFANRPINPFMYILLMYELIIRSNIKRMVSSFYNNSLNSPCFPLAYTCLFLSIFFFWYNMVGL
jgi:hypothetical protein